MHLATKKPFLQASRQAGSVGPRRSAEILGKKWTRQPCRTVFVSKQHIERVFKPGDPLPHKVEVGNMTWSFPLQWLSRQARPFLVSGKNVEVFYSPDFFFEALKVGNLKSLGKLLQDLNYCREVLWEQETVWFSHHSTWELDTERKSWFGNLFSVEQRARVLSPLLRSHNTLMWSQLFESSKRLRRTLCSCEEWGAPKDTSQHWPSLAGL